MGTEENIQEELKRRILRKLNDTTNPDKIIYLESEYLKLDKKGITGKNLQDKISNAEKTIKETDAKIEIISDRNEILGEYNRNIVNAIKTKDNNLVFKLFNEVDELVEKWEKPKTRELYQDLKGSTKLEKDVEKVSDKQLLRLIRL